MIFITIYANQHKKKVNAKTRKKSKLSGNLFPKRFYLLCKNTIYLQNFLTKNFYGINIFGLEKLDKKGNLRAQTDDKSGDSLEK